MALLLRVLFAVCALLWAFWTVQLVGIEVLFGVLGGLPIGRQDVVALVVACVLDPLALITWSWLLNRKRVNWPGIAFILAVATINVASYQFTVG